MKLTLCVPLIWMLFSSARALKCMQGSYTSNDRTDEVPQPCNTNEQCLTVAVQHFRGNQLEESITKRNCAPSSLCNEGKQSFSISYDDFRLTASLQCCSTDGCNNKTIPFLDEQKPNGLQCFTRYPWVESYIEEQQCMGIQDRCIVVNQSSATQFQGCASANLCEGNTDLKLKAVLIRSVDDWTKSLFSALECCGSSLCNSAPAYKLSVISLLLGLVALSVC